MALPRFCNLRRLTKVWWNVRKSRGCALYTVNHKKRDSLFLTITLAKLNRFFIVLYNFNREEIQRATHIT